MCCPRSYFAAAHSDAAVQPAQSFAVAGVYELLTVAVSRLACLVDAAAPNVSAAPAAVALGIVVAAATGDVVLPVSPSAGVFASLEFGAAIEYMTASFATVPAAPPFGAT